MVSSHSPDERLNDLILFIGARTECASWYVRLVVSTVGAGRPHTHENVRRAALKTLPADMSGCVHRFFAVFMGMRAQSPRLLSSGPVMRLTEEQAIALSDVDLPAWMGVPLREIPKAYDFRRLTTGEFLPSRLWFDNYIRVRARRGLRTFDPHSLSDIREFHALMRLDARVRMPKVRKYLLERREREASKRLAADRLRLENRSCQVSEVRRGELLHRGGGYLEERFSLARMSSCALCPPKRRTRFSLARMSSCALSSALGPLVPPPRSRTTRQSHGGLAS